MRFKVKANTAVKVRYGELDGWDPYNWSTIETERDVVFEEDDVWFIPANSDITKNVKTANTEPLNFCNHPFIQTLFGFHIPENDRLITQIIVIPEHVELISQPGISEAKKLEGKLKQTRKGYSFTGGPITGV